jgi:hypothetical protein
VHRPVSEFVAPWTCIGPHDPGYDDRARVAHQMLLTDALLLVGFRRRFPEHADAGYDEIVRLLGYVWDCAHDGTANVTGHCCGWCGRTRAAGQRARTGR